MKALIHLGEGLPWLPDPAGVSWGLRPAGNRPLLEFWIEAALEMGIRDIRLLLGEDAFEVERYAGDGSRWGVSFAVSLLREGMNPDDMLRRKASEFAEGILYVRAPSFPWRTSEKPLQTPAAGQAFALAGGAGCVGGSGIRVEDLLKDGLPDAETMGLKARGLSDAQSYYALNMELVNGEITRYVTPGYPLSEGSYIGYNVQTPPSCVLNPPIMVGNDSRLRPLSDVGPAAVIGHHVVVDSQTQIRNCVIMDGTYIGRNLDLDGKIVCGEVLVDPETGTALDLDDPLLMGRLEKEVDLRAAAARMVGWTIAVMIWLLQLPVFWLLLAWIRLRGSGRFRRETLPGIQEVETVVPCFHVERYGFSVRLFRALLLDRWPAIGRVVRGRLYLCGHEPIDSVAEPDARERLRGYVPAALSEELLFSRLSLLQRMIIRQQALHDRGGLDQLRLLGRVFSGRMMQLFTQPLQEELDA